MLQEIDVDRNIWGNIVSDLKLNKTRNEPIPVAGNLAQVSEELEKLH